LLRFSPENDFFNSFNKKNKSIHCQWINFFFRNSAREITFPLKLLTVVLVLVSYSLLLNEEKGFENILIKGTKRKKRVCHLFVRVVLLLLMLMMSSSFVVGRPLPLLSPLVSHLAALSTRSVLIFCFFVCLFSTKEIRNVYYHIYHMHMTFIFDILVLILLCVIGKHIYPYTCCVCTVTTTEVVVVHTTVRKFYLLTENSHTRRCVPNIHTCGSSR